MNRLTQLVSHFCGIDDTLIRQPAGLRSDFTSRSDQEIADEIIELLKDTENNGQELRKPVDKSIGPQ